MLDRVDPLPRWTPVPGGRRVLFLLNDNTNAVSWLQRFVCPDAAFNADLLALHFFLESVNAELVVGWLDGKVNVADPGSRGRRWDEEPNAEELRKRTWAAFQELAAASYPHLVEPDEFVPDRKRPRSSEDLQREEKY